MKRYFKVFFSKHIINNNNKALCIDSTQMTDLLDRKHIFTPDSEQFLMSSTKAT